MSTEGTKQMSDNDRIEQLRAILERQQARTITREEASEIGESLLTFFRVLGEDLADEQRV